MGIRTISVTPRFVYQLRSLQAAPLPRCSLNHPFRTSKTYRWSICWSCHNKANGAKHCQIMRGKQSEKHFAPDPLPPTPTFAYIWISATVWVLFANKAKIKSSQPSWARFKKNTTRHETVQEWRFAPLIGEVMIHDYVETRSWLLAGASGCRHCWALHKLLPARCWLIKYESVFVSLKLLLHRLLSCKSCQHQPPPASG